MGNKIDVEENWKEFWADILLNEDGSINLEQLKKELADYSYILDQVPKVYCHITGNKLSYPNYSAETVISVSDQYFSDKLEQEIEDFLHDYDIDKNSLDGYQSKEQ